MCVGTDLIALSLCDRYLLVIIIYTSLYHKQLIIIVTEVAIGLLANIKLALIEGSYPSPAST